MWFKSEAKKVKRKNGDKAPFVEKVEKLFGEIFLLQKKKREENRPRAKKNSLEECSKVGVINLVAKQFDDKLC